MRWLAYASCEKNYALRAGIIGIVKNIRMSCTKFDFALGVLIILLGLLKQNMMEGMLSLRWQHT